MRPISREQAVQQLTSIEPALRALGVERLALFGSVARNQSNAASDIDVLVRFSTGAKNYDRFLALNELLESLFGRPVDLVTPESLSPFLGPVILAEAQDVIRAA